VEDKRIQRPVFWKSCAQQQVVEQDPQALAEDCNVENCPDYLLPQSILALADTFVSDDDCKLRGYIVSEADAVKYSDAVIGASDKVDVNGMKISHVGEPTRSSSSVNWEPWVGQRTLRPITVAHTGRGSTIRNRFCLSADERNRRKLDLDAKRRAAETILESSESCDFADRMPDVDSTKWHLAGDHEDLHGIPEDLFDDYDFDDPGVFWRDLDDTMPEQAYPESNSALEEFNLFEHAPDQVGVCTAILDTLRMIEEGRIGNVDLCLSTVGRILGTAPNFSNGASPSAASRLSAVRARVVARLE
jgi:hypothetical protein